MGFYGCMAAYHRRDEGGKSIAPALNVAGPRMIEPKSDDMPVIIFTDGACEPDGTTIGGVLFVYG